MVSSEYLIQTPVKEEPSSSSGAELLQSPDKDEPSSSSAAEDVQENKKEDIESCRKPEKDPFAHLKNWVHEEDNIDEWQREDVEWLSSRSHSELDMLISIKKLAKHRAKVAGFEALGDTFDTKLLCATGAFLQEFLKERLKNRSAMSMSAEVPVCANDFEKYDSKDGVEKFTTDKDMDEQTSDSTPLKRKRKRYAWIE
ncbi:hypothetical protein AMTR_s00032p00138980 [Amborella trichopoda]|uniref:Uncharacterized protein n=1 Tax=Amborella trichopoda TaxID=13333 RepID=U5CXG9_AMBTC|nr:hypothetical protein AMTR_s00032p00138980 [Amborella trichopoda]